MSQSAFSFIRVQIEDGIATLLVDRPGTANALNPVVIHQLHQAFHEAAGQEQVRGIVLGAVGKTFVAGADVAFFVRCIDAGTLDRIDQFEVAAHAMLNEIEACRKPVVARVHGPAIGGGLELCLACHEIVASPQARFALPEAGTGHLSRPGRHAGRTPRRIGLGLAKWLLFTGPTLAGPDTRGHPRQRPLAG